MKTYQDISNAQIRFKERQNQFLKINYEFFLNLIRQIGEKAQLPAKDALIKFQYGTDDNINIVEEWLALDDNGVCSMRIAIICNEIKHNILFSTTKSNNKLILKIIIDNVQHDFDFDVSDFSKIKEIQFDTVVDFIIDSLIKIYDRWTF